MTDAAGRLAALAPEQRQILERLLREQAAPRGVSDGIVARPAGEPPMLSAAQRQLWFVSRRDPASPAANVPVVLRLRGRLAAAALARALAAVVARHEVLRTRVVEAAGEPRAVVERAAHCALRQVDLAALPPAAASAAAAAAAERETALPVDPAQAPLARATLLRLAADDQVLLLVVHHLAFDGGSAGVLLRELAASYTAAVAGEPPAWAPLPVQYADYARWESARLGGRHLEELVAWWRERLAGAAPELAFPGRSRGDRRSATTGAVPLALDASLSVAAGEFARQRGISLFVALLASWNAVLQRLCHADDLVVGVVSANRSRPEVAGLIGPFVNLLPVRTDLAGRPGFGALCARVNRALGGAMARQELPFDRLVRELHGRQAGVRHPLFNVVFNFQMAPAAGAAGVRMGDVVAAPLAAKGRTVPLPPKFDLTVSFVAAAPSAEGDGKGDGEEDGEGQGAGGAGALAGDVEFDPALFSEAEVTAIVAAWRHLLREALRQPEAPVARLGLLAAEPRAVVLEEWNRTAAPYPDTQGFHQLFEAWADRQPDRPAVVGGGLVLTYAELDRRANRLAHHLRRLGVGPGGVVAVLLERSVASAVALLGVLKAGGVFMGLDPRHASARLQAMVVAAGPAAAVTVAGLLPELPLGMAPVVCLDRAAAALGRAAVGRPRVDLHPEDLAYLVYTSGSTGAPKGVLCHHRGLCNLAMASRLRFQITPAGRVLHAASPGFDAFVWEAAMAWGAGAALHVASWEDALPGPAFNELLRREEITLVFRAPSAVAAAPPAELPAVRALLIGGEAWTPAVGGRYRVGGEIWNVYGPTECSAISLCEPRGAQADPPIGRPLPNLRAYVLDAGGEPLPPAFTGELHLGGVGLARGYAGRPDLTAERFLPDPFSPLPGSRMYATGDLARLLPDGRMVFAGRLDDQVQIRGMRVEPGEVQAALERHPALAQVAVAAVEREPGQLRLAAWYVPRPDRAAPEPAELRAWVEPRLPAHLRPAAFVRLGEMPLTAHGKIDRRRLPPPDWSAPADLSRGDEPRGAVEETLAEVWRQVLGAARVRREDNFYELGGDSILAIQIVARAAQEGLELGPGDLLTHQTIAGLAPMVRQARPILAPGPVGGPVPLLPIQRWFLERQRPEAAGEPFCHGVLLQPAGDLLPDLLPPAAAAAACRALYAHHDALRLRVRRTAAGWVQECMPPGAADPWCHLDLAALPPPRVRAEVERLAGRLAASFDLARGPLVRFAWIDLPRGRRQLLALAHHWVIDVYSWQVVLEDLVTGCRQAVHGEPVRLPAKTASLHAWALQLAALARSPQGTGELADWSAGLFASAAAARLPSDEDLADSTGAATVHAAAAVHTAAAALTAEETRRLLTAPVRTGASVQALLLAALARALAAWTGSPRQLVDVEGHGRELSLLDLTRTVGWLTALHPLPLRAKLPEPPRRTLERAQLLLDGMPRLAAALGPPAGLPERDLVFNYLGQLDRGGPAGSFFAEVPLPSRLLASDRHRRHAIEVGCEVHGGCFAVRWRLAAEHYRRASAERLAAAFLAEVRDLLATAAESPADAAGRIVESYGLSPLQEGILFQCLSRPDEALYLQQSNLVLHGPLDRGALERACQTALDRHAVLRTSFLWEAREAPLQRVHAGLRFPFRYEDWRPCDEAAARRRWQLWCDAELATPLPLDRPPLVRCTLIQVGAETHFLTWMSHHLALDGWSLSLLTGEILAVYRAAVAGREIRLPPPVPFAAFIAWLAQRGGAAETAFWQRLLAGFAEPVALPRPAAPPALAIAGGAVDNAGARGAQWIAHLGDGAAARLRDFGRDQRLTLNTLFQAAWAVVLSRYAGRRDLLYGLTVAGRPAEIPGVERAIGIFIHTLPLRLEVPRALPVAGWLPAVQHRLQEVQQHQTCSLAEVQRASDVPKDRPLFEILTLFQNFPAAPEDGDGGPLRIESTAPAIEATSYALTLIAEPGPPFSLRFIYDPRQLAAGLVEAMARHLAGALAALPDAARRAVEAWPMLDPVEVEQIVHGWNRTAWAVDWRELLPARIAAGARRWPERIAAECGGASLSYSELARRAGQLAAWLRSRAVGPEAVVALHAERSLELVVAVLAVLGAGGAMMPLPLADPPGRLAFLLAEARPRVVLTERRLRDRLPAVTVATPQAAPPPATIPATPQGASSEISLLDGRDRPWESLAAAVPAVADMPAGGAAYVLYTSGSTGTPKGVVNTHGGILNRVLWGQEAYPLGADDRVLQKTPYSFDVWVWEMLAPLAGGSRLVLARPGAQRDPDELAAAIERHGVTVVHFVPSMLQVFLEQPERARRCATVRRVVVSGEALPRSLCDAFFAAFARAELVNLYGPTEASVEVSHWPCRRGETAAAVPIGWPIANLRLLVLDAGGQVCPPLAPGELAIGGAGLARGYLARPDLTAERFRPDPFADGERLYHTGDLARYRSDGALEYLGRRDFQVKLRGQRIELGEIEEQLRACPGVRDAVVVCREDRDGDPRLVAYVVGETDAPALRELLAARLPEAMRPAAFVRLAALPHTASGKLDRRALPAPEPAARRDSLPPRDGLERELAALWADLLGVESVGVRDQFFFDLHGHSLLALRLLGRVARRWPGAGPALAEFLAEPTVEAMARRLRAAVSAAPEPAATPVAGPPSPVLPIQPAGSRPPLFLVHPAFGTVLGYYELARVLGADQPLYGFQAPGLDGGETVDDLAELARLYVAAMRRIQPVGPYRLGGFSFGGGVAFEMARQLLQPEESGRAGQAGQIGQIGRLGQPGRSGPEVAALVVIDTLGPAADPRPVVQDEARLLAELGRVLARYRGGEPAGAAEPGEDREVGGDSGGRAELQRGLDHLADPLGGPRLAGGVPRLEAVLAVQRAALAAAARYRPAVYPGRIDLVRCADPNPEDIAGVAPAILADPSLGWQRWCTRPVRVWKVPGDHISLLRAPDVEALARTVQGILEEVLEEVLEANREGDAGPADPAKRATPVTPVTPVTSVKTAADGALKP